MSMSFNTVHSEKWLKPLPSLYAPIIADIWRKSSAGVHNSFARCYRFWVLLHYEGGVDITNLTMQSFMSGFETYKSEGEDIAKQESMAKEEGGAQSERPEQVAQTAEVINPEAQKRIDVINTQIATLRKAVDEALKPISEGARGRDRNVVRRYQALLGVFDESFVNALAKAGCTIAVETATGEETGTSYSRVAEYVGLTLSTKIEIKRDGGKRLTLVDWKKDEVKGTSSQYDYDNWHILHEAVQKKAKDIKEILELLG